MALFIWSYTNLCEEERLNVIFSNLNYWLLRNDTSYKNMKRPIVNVHFTCTLGSYKCTHIMRCFQDVLHNCRELSLFSIFSTLDETYTLWSKHYDNCLALIVLLPKTQKRVYTEDSIFIKKNWFCSYSYIQLSDNSCKMTPLKTCLPFRQWNNVALKSSHVINICFALLVHFSFKRISCLKSLKSSWCNRLFACLVLLHIKILHDFPRFPFVQFFFPNLQWSNDVLSSWRLIFMITSIHVFSGTQYTWLLTCICDIGE